MYVLVGTCRIAGTVYFDLDPGADSLGTRPLGNFRLEDFEAAHWDIERKKREGKGREGKGRGGWLEVKNEKQQKENTTHSSLSVGSISGNSRKMVL